MKKKRTKIDISVFLAVFMELLLLIDMVIVLVKGETTLFGYVTNIIIAMVYVLMYLLEYINNKRQQKKENKVN